MSRERRRGLGGGGGGEVEGDRGTKRRYAMSIHRMRSTCIDLFNPNRSTVPPTIIRPCYFFSHMPAQSPHRSPRLLTHASHVSHLQLSPSPSSHPPMTFSRPFTMARTYVSSSSHSNRSRAILPRNETRCDVRHWRLRGRWSSGGSCEDGLGRDVSLNRLRKTATNAGDSR